MSVREGKVANILPNREENLGLNVSAISSKRSHAGDLC